MPSETSDAITNVLSSITDMIQSESGEDEDEESESPQIGLATYSNDSTNTFHITQGELVTDRSEPINLGAGPHQSEQMIVDEEYYKDHPAMPTLDQYIDPTAAAYVIHHDDGGALHFLVDHVQDAFEDDHLQAPPLEGDALRGAIEWWVRNHYDHLAPP